MLSSTAENGLILGPTAMQIYQQCMYLTRDSEGLSCYLKLDGFDGCQGLLFAARSSNLERDGMNRRR